MSVLSYEKQDQLWCALRRYPYGATAKQIAFDLKRPAASMASLMSKAHTYGHIDRIPLSHGHREYLYRVKQHLQAAE